MICLIAESKTMRADLGKVDPGTADRHTPAFETQAAEIMARMHDMPASAIAEAVRISPALAARSRSMIYDFPDKSSGLRAIEAFTGVVFKALDFTTLPTEAKEKAGSMVRIISSLYGWLRPDDIIKPYRLDFTSRVAPCGEPLTAFWRNRLTDRLLTELKESGSTEIIDLMPADAAKCFDWKRIASCADIYRIDLREIIDGGSTRTPRSNRLKQLRGLLLREILTGPVTTPEALRNLSSDTFLPVCDAPEGLIRFLV
ncbi:MAG: YaaA family protein [Paramuribaculum sp.]|nr:YaaA family protein [Paramuribaculum sp.]MDE6323100.1 YaaA family protein [Paramuribaculum sp.]MDE6487960.1 YaaA family protein [Paramuribaculum sp.]